MALIMIVDDSPDHTEMLTFCITNSGHEVVSAGDWTEAQKKLSEVTPDLFILDYNLPGITGKQIYDRLQGSQKTRSVPVIFMTAAYRIPENMSLGAKTKFMRKPVDLKYFQVHLKALLGPKGDPLAGGGTAPGPSDPPGPGPAAPPPSTS